MTTRRTSGWRSAVTRVTGIVAVTGMVAVGCGSGRQPSHATSASSVTSSSSVVSPPPPTRTVAELAHDHWSLLPPAPIAPRHQPVVAWTGDRMIVWGGASSDRNDAKLYADGASYDPQAKQWTTLPAAPISAREGMGWVWTGTSLVIFGGEGSPAPDGSRALYNDGAMYTPATNSWRKLAASPLSARTRPVLLWTGLQVIVLGGDLADTSFRGPGYATGAAEFLPLANRWNLLPAMPTTAGRDVRHLLGLSAGGEAYVWQAWQIITTTASETDMSGGYDVVMYHPETHSWTSDPSASTGAPNAPAGIDELVLGGNEIYSLPSQSWYGDESTAPPALTAQGSQLDRTTNTWSQTTHGPIDDLLPLGVWTGTALLDYTTQTISSIDGGPSTGPGESALYDPATKAWTSLPTAPDQGLGNNAVWAGDRLLEWGLVGLDFGPA